MKCSQLNASKLTVTLRVEEKTRVSDGFGGFDETWTTVTNSPTLCHYKLNNGRESVNYGGLSQTVWAHAFIRYESSMDENMRVHLLGKYHNIVYVEDLENQHQWMKLGLIQGQHS
jgi:head-tail adaptor